MINLSEGDRENKQWLRRKQQTWLENRLKIANAVRDMSDGETISSTFDAQIILCCALGAISAAMWPNAGDKVRYIQLLIDFCPALPSPATISISALLHDFKGEDEEEEIRNQLWTAPMYQTIEADQVDTDDATVISKIDSLPPAKVRQASYAHLIYKDLRCGLVHEYSLQDRLADWSLDDDLQTLHYTYFRENPVLFIPYEYFERVIKTTAESVFDFWYQSELFERNRPAPPKWWISG